MIISWYVIDFILFFGQTNQKYQQEFLYKESWFWLFWKFEETRGGEEKVSSILSMLLTGKNEEFAICLGNVVSCNNM